MSGGRNLAGTGQASGNGPPTVQPRGSRDGFEVYRAKTVARTYLVVSASAVRRGQDPPWLADHFDPAPALDRLAHELTQAFEPARDTPVPVTLKVHGFNTRRKSFERELVIDADPAHSQSFFPRRKLPPEFDPARETFRPDERFLIGFRWPSEGVFTPGSLLDTWSALWRSPAVGVFLLLGPALTVLWLCWLRRPLPALGDVWRVLLLPYLDGCVAAILLGVGCLFLTLRVSTYLRDRYRALHYGVPDLGEFMRALEERLYPRGVRIQLDVIGHSMGALVVINAFRVMSDYFHGLGPGGPGGLIGPDRPGPAKDRGLGRGGTFQLGSLILCAADIPAAMATPDRNNYFLSALRRFDAIHVFSSDRDIILKWLSSLANWASEPRFDMSGRKLGNVLLIRTAPSRLRHPDSRADWTLCPVTRPVLRHYQLYEEDPILSARYPATLHFHDCSRDRSVSGTELAAVVITGLVLVVVAGAAAILDLAALWWLAAQIALFVGLGLLCRPLWTRLRDRPGLGGVAGFFAEWTTLMMFPAFRRGWNPHGGYFMLHQAPRQRISAILRDPSLYPPRDPGGREIEELDDFIRYRMVRLSV